MKPESVPVSNSELHREMLLGKRRQLLEECCADSSLSEEWGRVADHDQPTMLHDQFVTLHRQGLAYQTLKLVDAAWR